MQSWLCKDYTCFNYLIWYCLSIWPLWSQNNFSPQRHFKVLKDTLSFPCGITRLALNCESIVPFPPVQNLREKDYFWDSLWIGEMICGNVAQSDMINLFKACIKCSGSALIPYQSNWQYSPQQIFLPLSKHDAIPTPKLQCLGTLMPFCTICFSALWEMKAVLRRKWKGGWLC